jgi:hypothetical protein
MGDFNSSSHGQDCSGYETITGKQPLVEISQDFLQAFPVPKNSKSFTMLDLMGETPRRYVSGNYGDFFLFFTDFY